MEPEALTYVEQSVATACDTGAVALASIAISLKRIADEVCGIPYDHAPGADNKAHRMGLVDGIMHAIEQGIVSGGNRG